MSNVINQKYIEERYVAFKDALDLYNEEDARAIIFELEDLGYNTASMENELAEWKKEVEEANSYYHDIEQSLRHAVGY